MDLDTYQQSAWNNDIANKLSWRGILCRQFKWDNRNFSQGGSSNQRQFRLAKQYFSSREWQRDRAHYNKILVLWGITSTARNELWSIEGNQLLNFQYHKKPLSDLTKSIVAFNYNHANEVRNLSLEIVFWNNFFQSQGIDNRWFDTFNHHDYACDWPGLQEDYEKWAGDDWPTWHQYLKNDFNVSPEVRNEIQDLDRWRFAREYSQIDRLIDHHHRPRDILSFLAKHHNIDFDNEYHYSNWKIDSKRVSGLVEVGILNPFSYHPTQIGHAQIAGWFQDRIPEWF